MHCLEGTYLCVFLLVATQSSMVEAQNNSITVNFTVNGADPNLDLSKFASDLPSNIQIQTIVDDIQVAVVPICPSGYYCPADTTVPVPCPVGTYFNGTNANSVDQCLLCTRGSICPTQATINPILCPPNQYSLTNFSSCKNCTAFSTSPQGSDMCTCNAGYTNASHPVMDIFSDIQDFTCQICPTGFYKATTGQIPCLPCPPGTFCKSPGTVTPQSCEPGKYCPLNSTTPTNCSINTYRVKTGASSALECISCPSNTVGPSGSTTILNCRCVTGYVCTYTKTITATVTLNTTYPAFDQNVGNVRTAFQQAIANAAGVPIGRVSILGFAARSSNRRRLLSMFSGPDVHSGLVVRAEIHGAERLHELEVHLKKHSETLHIDHEWMANHGISVIPM